MNKKIFVFGDSIAWGAWDVEGGWVMRLKKKIDEQVISSDYDYYIALYNLSVSGDTSGDVLERFEKEMKARIEQDKEVCIIFAFGINDTYVDLAAKTNEVDFIEFKQNVAALYEQARKVTPEIVFVGLTPVDESLVNPIPWKQGFGYFNEEIERYDSFLTSFCEEKACVYIDVSRGFDQEEFLADGLHPNTQGHEKMYRRIKELLVSNSII